MAKKKASGRSTCAKKTTGTKKQPTKADRISTVAKAPIYELWRETAKLQLPERQEITEFAYRSVGTDRTQLFPNFPERRLTAPRSRACDQRAPQAHNDGRAKGKIGRGENAKPFDSSSVNCSAATNRPISWQSDRLAFPVSPLHVSDFRFAYFLYGTARGISPTRGHRYGAARGFGGYWERYSKRQR